MKTLLVAVVAVVLLASPAWAGSRTITLAVSNMTCAACPITVKKALTKIHGVSAATDAGYPSRIKERK